MRRVVLLAVGLAVVFAISFVLCQHLGILTDQSLRDWLGRLPPGWTLVAVAGLLAADLVMPVPSSVVLAAGGAAAGWLPAAAAGTVGMLAGNLAGYWLCRLVGQRASTWLIKPAEALRLRRSASAGGWTAGARRR